MAVLWTARHINWQDSCLHTCIKALNRLNDSQLKLCTQQWGILLHLKKVETTRLLSFVLVSIRVIHRPCEVHYRYIMCCISIILWHLLQPKETLVLCCTPTLDHLDFRECLSTALFPWRLLVLLLFGFAYVCLCRTKTGSSLKAVLYNSFTSPLMHNIN